MKRKSLPIDAAKSDEARHQMDAKKLRSDQENNATPRTGPGKHHTYARMHSNKLSHM